MNIFATSPDPVESAMALDDRRLVKMILETAQLLSSAVLHKRAIKGLYKPTHKNHPCGIWARKSRQNFEWLVAHGLAMSEIYAQAFGRSHKSSDIIRRAARFSYLMTASRSPRFRIAQL